MSGATLRHIFEAVGRVVDCNLLRDQHRGGHRGRASIKMGDLESSQRAIAQLHMQQVRSLSYHLFDKRLPVVVIVVAELICMYG